MTVITINKKIFEKEIGKFDDKMQERIAMFGTPIENISDAEIQIEIFPNRPDLISYHAFKRSFLAFLGKKTGLKNYKLNKSENYKVIVDSSVKEVRPHTVCAIIKGLKLDNEKIKELIEIQEKLHFTVGRKRKKAAIGIYPLDKIKFPVTYKALEPDKIKFLPLEAQKEMTGLQILQNHSTGKDYAHLLAGKAKFPIFIDANNEILSMPPIINSQLTGRITETTKDVFVECSGFDFDVLEKILNIIVTAFAEMGGQIYQVELKGGKKSITPNLVSEKMKISLENTNKILGLNLNENSLKKLIEKMGYNYSKGIVEIPSWRTDILHEIDLIEDVAIAYGYENFVPEIPSISTIGKENQKEIIKKKIAEILSGLNILEVSNFHLTTKREQFEKMGISKKEEKNFVKIEESKTDYNILRKDLTSYLLKNLAENVDSEYPQKIFETGLTFNETEEGIKKTSWAGGRGSGALEGGANISEKENLAVAITPGNFTEIKQILEYLSRMINLKLELKESEDIPEHFIDGRCAEIVISSENSNTDNKSSLHGAGGRGAGGGTSIGFIGELHPKILRNWRIKMPVALLEINLEEIFERLR